MAILGVDLSTKAIDLVLLDEDDPAQATHHRIALATPWWNAATDMRNTLRGIDHSENVHLAGIERPYGPSRQVIASLHTILGAVLASMPAHITCLEIRPADMRHELGLPGNCPKETMHFAVNRHFEEHGTCYTLWPPDAYDAWAAGHAALRMCERAAEKKVS